MNKGLLFNPVQELIDKAVFLYGTRLKDGKCVYCEKPVIDYCDCVRSDKINKIAKRVHKKVADFENGSILGEVPDFVRGRNVPLKYANAELSMYKARDNNEQEILNTLKRYQDNIVINYLSGKNLILLGNFGTAKTLLMSALCNFITYEVNLSAKFINIVDLLAEVMSTFRDGTEKKELDVVDQYLSYDFLFIDDFDKCKDPKNWEEKLIYKIINRRYEEFKPIVISTNKGFNDLDRMYGEASLSRLRENCIEVYFRSENERIRKAVDNGLEA